MFHEVLTFSTSFEILINSMKTHLFAMLLSNQADHDLTDLKSHVMINVMINVIINVIINVNLKKFL